MEGFAVLRACELAGVPALEVRAVVNEITEPDRAPLAVRRRDRAPPRRRAAAARGARCLSCRRRFRPASAPSGSSSPRRSASTATTSGARSRSGCRSPSLDQLDLGRGDEIRDRALPRRARRSSRSRSPTPRAIAGKRRAERRGRSPWRPRSAPSCSLPASLVFTWFALLAAVYLAFFGLAVPVAVLEGAGPRASLRRALELGRADYVHALGSIAALVIVFFLSRQVLVLLLRGQADETIRVAIFLADLVLAPLMLLGDGDALLRPGRPRRRRPQGARASRPTRRSASGLNAPTAASTSRRVERRVTELLRESSTDCTSSLGSSLASGRSLPRAEDRPDGTNRPLPARGVRRKSRASERANASRAARLDARADRGRSAAIASLARCSSRDATAGSR